jgi:hypothetical protein
MLCASSAAQSQSTQSAASAPASARAGLIVGQVTDAATREPIADAVVTLQPVVNRAGDATPFRGRVLSDARGQFFFEGLPAGTYMLTADKPGFVAGVFGKTRPDGAGLTFELDTDERRADARVSLWRFGAIGGTVVDEFGDPMAGIRVQALRRRMVGGRLLYGLTGADYSSVTDDRGMYRMGSVAPADYIVAVVSTQTTVPATVLSQYLVQGTPAVQTELFAATSEISTLGNPRNQQLGDAVLMTRSGSPFPGSPNDAGQFETYPTTFYPAATRVGEASIVTLRSGEDRSGLNIQMRPLRAVRVLGRLVGPSESLPPTALRLSPVNVDGVPTSIADTVTGVSGAGGAFTLLGVPAGQYLLKVQSPASKPLLSASELITVGDVDLTGLTVAVRLSTHVTGRFVDVSSTANREAVATRDVTFELSSSDPPRISAKTDAQGRFSADLPPGKYVMRTARLDEYSRWVRTITVAGKDVTDTRFEVKTDPVDIVVTLTDRETRISGVARDPAAGPDPMAFVVVFPVERTLWASYGSVQGSRRLRSVRTGRGGTFECPDLAPGTYFVAAMPESAMGDWTAPAFLETLSRSAERVVLSEGEHKQVNVQVVR